MLFSEEFSQERYESEVSALFRRFPSVQDVPFADAYKPGLERMYAFAEELGSPQRSYRIIHVAGTNGKGSVSNMLASALSASGHCTGLFTSPHIEDFRERMRILDGCGMRMPGKEWVYGFIVRYREVFERLSLSFFEITTGMAMKWFQEQGADTAVFEVGLGGRLDSTNIVEPELCIITSIGLDHCDLLGNTLEEIAAEKAGIIKEGVPVVIGEALPQTRPVFERAASAKGAPLIFSEDSSPWLWEHKDAILDSMDLRGHYQEKNLRTVLTALPLFEQGLDAEVVMDAVEHTAARADFHGRWEVLSDNPLTICDIGHNAHALRNNFRQLEDMGRPLIIVYAVMADKDLGAILPLMPEKAHYIFTAPATRRALAASELLGRFLESRNGSGDAEACDSVREAVGKAVKLSRTQGFEGSVIYIGGSTFAVSEAAPMFKGGVYIGKE